MAYSFAVGQYKSFDCNNIEFVFYTLKKNYIFSNINLVQLAE